MNNFFRVLQFARPYRSYGFLNIIFNLLYSLFSIISVASFMPILNILFDKGQTVPELDENNAISFENLKAHLYTQTYEAIEKYGELRVLAYFCLVTVGLFFLRNLFRYLAQYYMVGLRTGVTRDIRNRLYDKILALPVSYFTEQRKGDLITRISNDVTVVERYILSTIVEIVRSPLMLIFSLATLFFINYQLTLAALIILPIMGYLISAISKSLRRNASKKQKKLGELLSIVEETLGASKIVKIFNAGPHLSKRFHKSNDEWRTFTNKVNRRSDLSSPMSEFLGSATMIMLVYFGGRLIFSGDSSMDGETFLVFIAFFFQMLDPAKMLSKSFSDIAQGNASAERIFEILDTDVKVRDKQNAQSVLSFNHEIKFNNISFSYDENSPVIKDLTLVINKGERVALVGQSGSGKTTMANLLARFYDVEKGQILLDDRDIRDLKMKDYRQLMGMVTQESVLFNDTIFGNIALGKENATLEEVEKAAKVANAHEFIVQLPNGYYENIGEGGSKLSGGQKQRISIARAVLKNPPIMILDEATSALDTQSERLVQDALDHMMMNRTSLVIAHRLSTIQNADKIVVMNDGEISEMGNHQQLLEMNGLYANLIRMQNFD